MGCEQGDAIQAMFNEGAKPLFTILKRLFRLLTLGDILCRSDDADDAIFFFIPQRPRKITQVAHLSRFGDDAVLGYALLTSKNSFHVLICACEVIWMN